MNLCTILIAPIAILLTMLSADIGCVKYAMVEKDLKGFGYSHMQEVIELCKQDSTFKKIESIQRRKSKVVETVSLKVSTGSWRIAQDTLITYTIDSTYQVPLEHRYVIKNNQLLPITLGRQPFSFKRQKYRYKFYSGNRSVIN